MAVTVEVPAVVGAGEATVRAHVAQGEGGEAVRATVVEGARVAVVVAKKDVGAPGEEDSHRLATEGAGREDRVKEAGRLDHARRG